MSSSDGQYSASRSRSPLLLPAIFSQERINGGDEIADEAGGKDRATGGTEYQRRAKGDGVARIDAAGEGLKT